MYALVTWFWFQWETYHCILQNSAPFYWSFVKLLNSHSHYFLPLLYALFNGNFSNATGGRPGKRLSQDNGCIILAHIGNIRAKQHHRNVVESEVVYEVSHRSDSGRTAVRRRSHYTIWNVRYVWLNTVKLQVLLSHHTMLYRFTSPELTFMQLGSVTLLRRYVLYVCTISDTFIFDIWWKHLNILKLCLLGIPKYVRSQNDGYISLIKNK